MQLTTADDDELVETCLSERRLLGSAKFGKYTVVRRRDDLSNGTTCVAVGSAISTYGRMRLFELMFAVRQAGEEVYYCDTDSIMTSCKLSDYPHILHEFVSDWNTQTPGAALGSLKNELDADLQKKRALPPGLHEKQFNTLYLLGAKFYCLVYRDGDITHKICKSKGYKVTADQPLLERNYELMCENMDEIDELFKGGGSGTQTPREQCQQLGMLLNRQLQMPFSKTIMLDVLDNEMKAVGWRVRHRVTERLFKPVYHKGIVEQAQGCKIIKPFVLTDLGMESLDGTGEVKPVRRIVNNET